MFLFVKSNDCSYTVFLLVQQRYWSSKYSRFIFVCQEIFLFYLENWAQTFRYKVGGRDDDIVSWFNHYRYLHKDMKKHGWRFIVVGWTCLLILLYSFIRCWSDIRLKYARHPVSSQIHIIQPNPRLLYQTCNPCI